MKSKLICMSWLTLSLLTVTGVRAEGEDEIEIKDFQCGFNMEFDIKASACCIKATTAVANVIATIVQPGSGYITDLIGKGLSVLKSDEPTPVKKLKFDFNSEGLNEQEDTVNLSGKAIVDIYSDGNTKLRVKNPVVTITKKSSQKQTPKTYKLNLTAPLIHTQNTVERIKVTSKKSTAGERIIHAFTGNTNNLASVDANYKQEKSTFGCFGKCAGRTGHAKVSIDKWALLTDGIDFGDIKLDRPQHSTKSSVYKASQVKALRDINKHLDKEKDEDEDVNNAEIKQKKNKKKKEKVTEEEKENSEKDNIESSKS